MLLTKVKSAVLLLVVIGLGTLSGGALISQSLATEPAAGQAPGRASRADLQDRVAELKRQLQHMQGEIARLERVAQSPAEGPGRPDALLAGRLKYKVPFETGYTETREGGRLEILEVWGTRPRIEVGGQYLVRGRYVLPPGQRGKVYFYETATGNAGQGWINDLDLQSVTVEGERGAFTVLHGMAGPGYFHLVLADPERYSRAFAYVYFGTGANVLRKRP